MLKMADILLDKATAQEDLCDYEGAEFSIERAISILD